MMIMNDILTKLVWKDIKACWRNKGFYPYIKWDKDWNLKDNYDDIGKSVNIPENKIIISRAR